MPESPLSQIRRLIEMLLTSPPCVVKMEGDNLFLRDFFLSNLKKSLRSSANTLEVFSATQIQDIFQLCCERDLFSEKIFRVIKDIEKDKSFAKKLQTLKSKPQVHLILCSSKPFAVPESYGKAFILSCAKFKPADLSQFVFDLGSYFNLVLTAQDTRKFLDATGQEPDQIFNEMKKLALLAQSSSEHAVSITPWLSYLDTLKEEHMFQIENLLLSKNFPRLHLITDRLLDQGAPALVLLSILAKCFRHLMRWKMNLPPLGFISAHLRTSYNRASANYTLEELSSYLQLCQQIDCKLKGGSKQHESLIFSDLFFQIR